MARFLKHTSCNKCGSSDANALYDDGSSWCFSCCSRGSSSSGFRVRASVSGEGEEHYQIPEDCTSVLSGRAVEWVSRYGLSPTELLKHHVKYSPARQQVVFTFPPTDLWQARNLHPDARVKYFTSGNHHNHLPIYHCGKSVEALVLVEDCLSAIKIASAGPLNGLWLDSMPLLGSHLPTSKLRGLQRLYSHVVVWLDHDKGKEAQKIARQASILGLSSRCVFTELDPKEYSYDTLRQYLYPEL